MGDAFGFKVVDGFDQLFAKALQHVERQTAFLLELLRKVFVTRTFEQQRGAASDGEGLAVGNDVVVVQAGQYLALGQEALVVTDIDSDFEHAFFIAAVAAYQQGVARRSTPRAFDNGEPAFESVAGAGDAGVYRGFGVGRGQFVLDQIEVVEEALDGVVTRQQVRRGCELDQLLLAGTAAVQGVGQAKALTCAQFFGQLQRGLCRGLTRKDVEGNAAEREHVQAGTLGGVGPGGFGRQVEQARVFDIVFYVARAGGAVHGVG